MRPAFSTRICSASATVDRRCATTRVVRPARAFLSVFWIAASVRLSSALVASSRMRMQGSASRARAMPTR
ncbi:hypothetical protein D3C72_2312460 [compost metagenome]